MSSKFAVLLPVTSRKKESTILNELETFGKQVIGKATSGKCNISVYLGIDNDDVILNNNAARLALERSGCTVASVQSFSPSTIPAICTYWRELAHKAYKDGCEYFILLGDDVTIDEYWADKVCEEFEKMHEQFPQLPFGFGCIALNDEGASGFPTFPVLHRIHMNIFTELFPEEFVNQDADPFLFQLYKRWAASRFLSTVKIRNAIGGLQLAENNNYVPPRYERQHVEWKFEILQKHEKILEDWIIKTCSKSEIPSKKITLDVVTPSYRVNKEFLKRIINLDVPPEFETMFIVVVDDPMHNIQWLREEEKNRNGKFRVRRNNVNMGASETRNCGISESAADWILFLDDDVIPSKNLLNAYKEAILADGNKYDGFVGCTVLPIEDSISTAAIHLSDITYFWNISQKQKETPWAVTANIVVRRSKIRFDPEFIKTGGGEDIDYCLKMEKRPLKTVKNAVVEHPWWNNGGRCYGHFFNWALGDYLLIEKYPQFTYRTLPNLWETILLLLLLLPILGYKAIVSIFLAWTVDAVSDLIRNLHGRNHVHPISGWRRWIGIKKKMKFKIIAALESNIVKNSSELGHILAPLRRGKVLNLTKRFDFFCGSALGVIQEQQMKHQKRFSLFLAAILVTCAYF